MKPFAFFFSFLFLNGSVTFAYKLLVIVPQLSRSHFKTFEPFFQKLVKFHNVTLVGHYPLTNPTGKYQFISLSEKYENPFWNIDQFRMSNLKLLYFFNQAPSQQYMEYLNRNEVKDFLNSSEKFDLIILETFVSRLFNAIIEKFKAPFIYISSTSLFPHVSNNIRDCHNPAYIASTHGGYSSGMSFLERVVHTLDTFTHILWLNAVVESTSQSLAEKYFNPPPKSLIEAEKNVSLVLVNTHFTYIQSKPLPPVVIDVGGINIVPRKPLPTNIEKFINESQHGVIYFCMGSLLRGETFPEEKRNAFLYAFSKVPQRVLWKWEGDVLPGKSDNIMISKWMPQRDILAHPNIKLFISHGGLLGTSEAVYEGVPVLGIPIFGDQRTNIKALEANGAGELLDYNEISGEVVLEKIQRLVNDPKYSENAKQLSARYRDRPMSPLDTAVYWTEYVIRHKGAPHLKTAAVDMPWYQYLLLDVIAFLLFIFVSVLLIIYYSVKISLRFLYSLICGKSSSSKSAKKVKRN